jgi:hypothetical protein
MAHEGWGTCTADAGRHLSVVTDPNAAADELPVFTAGSAVVSAMAAYAEVGEDELAILETVSLVAHQGYSDRVGHRSRALELCAFWGCRCLPERRTHRPQKLRLTSYWGGRSRSSVPLQSAIAYLPARFRLS